MGPQLLPWHSQFQGSARAQAPNGEVRGGYPADCIAPASPDHNSKVKSQASVGNRLFSGPLAKFGPTNDI